MNRTEIMDMAVTLGEKIAQDEEVKKLAVLNEQYETDTALQTLMTEYNAQTQVLTMEYAKDESERDETVAQLVQDRINEIYKAVSENPLIVEFQKVQDNVNALMNQVNGEIQFGMTGKRPDAGCTHDCSTCGGCH